MNVILPKRIKYINKVHSYNNKYYKNNSLYYHKLYEIHSDSEEENQNQSKPLLKEIKLKERIHKMNLLKKVFKGPQVKRNIPNWPKITHPKLPFSNTYIQEKENKKKKIESLRPSRLYHDFHTIGWLRKKYSESVLEKSVFSILPENGKPAIPLNESEDEKRKRKIMEYLQSLREPMGREKYAKINPKYFYNESTYEKIMKLKEIFLEFDGGGKRKMEMNELLKLFNQNHIMANIEELVKLFFSDKKVKKEDYFKLYLNFYEFLNFALTKEQNFRNFMRKIKEKYKKMENNEKKNVENKEGKKSNYNDVYLPMNLNLVLDYFISKGKERSSVEKIEKAINEMDKLIKENNINYDEYLSEKELNYNDLKIENSKSKSKNKHKNNNIKSQENSKRYGIRKISNRDLIKVNEHSYKSYDLKELKNNSKNNLKLFNKNESKELDLVYDKINFKQLIQEFSKLFNNNGLNETQYNDKNKTFICNKSYNKNLEKKLYNIDLTKIRRTSKDLHSYSTNNLNSPKFSDSHTLNENGSDENETKKKNSLNKLVKMKIQNYAKKDDNRYTFNSNSQQIKKMLENNNINSYNNILEKNLAENNLKKSNSQQLFPDINMANTYNKKELKKPLINKYKKIEILNKSKNFPNYKNNSIKILKLNKQNLSRIYNNNNNYFSEINNNYSRLCPTNRTFLNVFGGKSQLINMSQEQTDFASKSKFDYVPHEFFSTMKEN